MLGQSEARSEVRVMVTLLQNAGSHRILAIMAGLQGENPIQLVELSGRTAYQTRGKITEGSAEKFIKMLRDRGHESVLEHSAMTVEFNDVSRGFTHELVRHRLVAYTQESTRRVDESDFRAVIPPSKDPDEKLVELNLPSSYSRSLAQDLPPIEVSFREWLELNEQMYRGLRKAGWHTEDARQVLPIGIKSQIVATANFKEWRHIFKLRTPPDTHWEIRRVMRNLLQDVKQRVPIIFDDIEIEGLTDG